MIRRLHLATGLVLFAFLLSHLLNHSLGLISLEAMERGRQVFLALWRNPPGTALLYGALLLHLGFALRALYRRRRLLMPPWEMTQTLLGLAIPPLLAIHVLGTRFAHEVYGLEDQYLRVLLILRVFDPAAGWQQVLVLCVAWLHGCIGLHFWLRFRPGYARLVPLVYGGALLLPILALLGFYVAGKEAAAIAADPVQLAAVQRALNVPEPAEIAEIYRLKDWLQAGFAGLLLLVLLAQAVRAWLNRRRGIVQITYPDGRRARMITGTTILEASRSAGIPHASVCGGRGRCSTCRVRIGDGLERLPAPSEAEARVLRRIGVAPNVRLACQTRPVADVSVTPLLPPTIGPRETSRLARRLQGDEREVAILFADLRDFTGLTQHKLPYDVVFVLNRYFAAMGLAVEESGGRVDKFIGDGIMALFGIERGPRVDCRNALRAARRMAERLVEVNAALAHDLEQPLRIGIGIHVGPVIVGEMGYGSATSVTAIGDAVNTASRLEALTKELDAQLVLSEP
ncbi:MAG TPA: adenylate/guanylate cyclase domain-containing protein, partial [Kiloniellales bacterium]|nr:adenylate/guanylate cyclase domain-containing protein [Kiloniellales bacterium]